MDKAPRGLGALNDPLGSKASTDRLRSQDRKAACAAGVTDRKRVIDAFDAFNSRDIKRLLDYLSDHVDWPDGDVRLQGREAVKHYWMDQWTRTQTNDTLTKVTVLPDRRVDVHLNQVVRSVDGDELSRGSFEYMFELREGLIVRLDIVKQR